MPTQAVPLHAFRVFFPAASLYAALAVPLAVAGHLGFLSVPGLAAGGHAREMLFGFALALVAGYTLGPTGRGQLGLLFGVWLLARLSQLVAPQTLLAQLASPAFAVLLAVTVVPRFQVAKKWRNRMVGPLIAVLCLIPVFWALESMGLASHGRDQWLAPALILFSLLMTFMGGRLIAPAAAGALHKRGVELQARVQPRLEAVLILLLAAAALTGLFPAAKPVTDVLLVATSLALFLRLIRWRLWLCRHRPDLLGLGLGYGWLALGVGLLGLALWRGSVLTHVLHFLTVGAMGSLSVGVMARLHSQRRRRAPPPSGLLGVCLALVSLAALLRGTATHTLLDYDTALILAATAWSLAYSILGVYLLLPGRARAGHRTTATHPV